MKTLEEYINENQERLPKIFTLKNNSFRVLLLGKEILLDGRKSRAKSSKGIGNTPAEAFENALKN